MFASDREEPPLELIIVPSASTGDGDQCRRSPAKKKKKPIANSSSFLHVVAGGDDLALISVHELKFAIERKVCTIASCGENLPDKGAKLKVQLKRLEDELELRRIQERLDFFASHHLLSTHKWVPRQPNDYDCGLFVPYYMERFVQDAPDRLKKQHSTMFGKNWLKPQEACSPRRRIKHMLQEEFRKALKEGNSMSQPVRLS